MRVEDKGGPGRRVRESIGFSLQRLRVDGTNLCKVSSKGQ